MQMDGKLLSRAIRNAIKRMRVEKEFQPNEKKYSRLIENLQEGICFIDKNAYTTSINRRMAEMLGYTVEEMLAKSLFSFMDEGSAEICKNYLECLKGSGEKQQELEFLRKNGTKVYVNMKISFLTDDDENYLGAIAAILDLTEYKRAEEQIKASLAEREVLLGEIHHRVKTNMQIVSSLLSLQASQTKNKDFIKMVKNTQSRIRSIALIHENLYRSQDLSKINFSGYVPSLVIHLFQFNQVNSNLIKLKMNLDNVFLDIQTAIPCALILNELITNSLKHAFPGGRGGEIIVELHPLEEHTFQMIVKDNGVGIPKGLDIEHTSTLGLQIAAMLVKQVEGSMEVLQEGGTTFMIVFRDLRSKFSLRYSCCSRHW
jgi:PAS domain S-box-containing protein